MINLITGELSILRGNHILKTKKKQGKTQCFLNSQYIDINCYVRRNFSHPKDLKKLKYFAIKRARRVT